MDKNRAPIEKAMVIRFVVLLIVLVNQFLVLSGFSPLPFDDAQIEGAVTSTSTVVVMLWTFWKDNNVTYKARRRAEYNKEKGLN